MELSLAGKHALVGGGSRGIGRAAARQLATLGADVTVMARGREDLLATVAGLDAGDCQAHGFLVADAAKPMATAARVAELVADKPVHIWVNNTGGPPDGLLHPAPLESLSEAFTRHVICAQAILHVLLPGMRAAGHGRIINVISTSVKQPIPGLGVSNTIRGAVANWAKTLAEELGPDGITVNNVLPGFTETARLDELIAARAETAGAAVEAVAAALRAAVPLRRFAQASETGAAIGFLASPAASYINGVNLPVDGGRTGSL
jgi:3-oxoacyl-[acyl-carrier protein] reductase